MKRKFLPAATLFIFFILFTLFAASAASAAITAQEYRNVSFDMGQVRTVVVMPIKIPASLSDAGLVKNVKYRWGELIQRKRGEGGYAVLTPDQLLARHYAAQGLKPKKWANDHERVRYVNDIAPLYADAMLTMTVTSCDYSSYGAPARYVSADGFEEVKDWDENGRITARKERVTERALKPAHTVRQSEAACRAELWSLARGSQTLIYSCAAGAVNSSEIYGDKLPSREKTALDVMDYVMKRVPVK